VRVPFKKRLLFRCFTNGVPAVVNRGAKYEDFDNHKRCKCKRRVATGELEKPWGVRGWKPPPGGSVEYAYHCARARFVTQNNAFQTFACVINDNNIRNTSLYTYTAIIRCVLIGAAVPIAAAI